MRLKTENPEEDGIMSGTGLLGSWSRIVKGETKFENQEDLNKEQAREIERAYLLKYYAADL